MFWRGAAGRLGKVALSTCRAARSTETALEASQISLQTGAGHRAQALSRCLPELTSHCFATGAQQQSAPDGSSADAQPSDSQATSRKATEQNGTEADAFASAETVPDEAASSGRTESAGQSSQPNLSADELAELLAEKDAALEEQQQMMQEANNRALRAMADLENMRDRSARQADSSRKFAVQGFAKGLLDVADNLERAFEVAGDDAKRVESLEPEKAKSLLRSLLDGLQMTDKILIQVFQQHGLERYRPMKEKFDPNLHNALFEIPDPGQKPGTIAVVTKAGYKLHDRVLRPAEVGVVREADGASAP